MKKRMTNMEEGLRQKEAELEAIRVAEEQEESLNAIRIKELQSRVRELEGAIKERDEVKDGMDTTEEESELAELKTALEACEKELAGHMNRANGAEVRDTFPDTSSLLL